MVPVVGRSGAVREQKTFVAAVVGVAHGRVDTHVGRDAGERDVLNVLAMEQQVQVRPVEGTLAGFVDDCFTRERREFRDDLPTWLPANEDSSARSWIADARADLP